MDIIWHIKKKIQDYKYRKVKLGKNSRINLGVNLSNPQNIIIGSNSYINGGDLIAGDNSKIIIGNDCLISYNVHFRTKTHNYEKKNELIRNQGHSEKDIIIEDDVWIGYGAQIMPGCRLKRGCVVGAGAIVTKDVEEYAVVAGVPAKIIKYRK